MNKIIFMWCHPRSMSTAVERIMRERGDLQCLHEPFMYDYYINRQIRQMPYFDNRDDHPITYEAVRDMIIERAQQGAVFVKDMSYYVVPQMLQDTEFLQRCSHFFLIRNPLASIASYYKLDQQVTLEEIGLESQWLHHEGLSAIGIDAPIVEAESIRADPRASIGKLWKSLGLDFQGHAFEWESDNLKSGSNVPEHTEDWQQVSGWHQSVLGSSHIEPITADESSSQQKNFERLAIDSPHLQTFYEHHHPYYLKLKANSLKL